jgi:hypothetical protein
MIVLSFLSLFLPMFFVQIADSPTRWFWEGARWQDLYWFQLDLICVQFFLGLLVLLSPRIPIDLKLLAMLALTVGYFVVGGLVVLIRGNGGLRWF